MSLPVRGAWVEISHHGRWYAVSLSRSPCGERGLKCNRADSVASSFRRSPCGERGLK